MSMQQDILERIIRQATKGYKEWQVEPFVIHVEKNEIKTDHPAILSELFNVQARKYTEVQTHLILNNDIVILTSVDVDIPITASLTMEAHNNLFKTTRAEYIGMTFNKYQAFERYLKISMKQYGEFIPFTLEFLKVKPSI